MSEKIPHTMQRIGSRFYKPNIQIFGGNNRKFEKGVTGNYCENTDYYKQVIANRKAGKFAPMYETTRKGPKGRGNRIMYCHRPRQVAKKGMMERQRVKKEKLDKLNVKKKEEQKWRKIRRAQKQLMRNAFA